MTSSKQWNLPTTVKYAGKKQQTPMKSWCHFLLFSEKNSSKHPVGFLTVGNKTAPLLTQEGAEFFCAPHLSVTINSNELSRTITHRPQTQNISRPAKKSPKPLLASYSCLASLPHLGWESSSARVNPCAKLCTVASTFNYLWLIPLLNPPCECEEGSHFPLNSVQRSVSFEESQV